MSRGCELATRSGGVGITGDKKVSLFPDAPQAAWGHDFTDPCITCDGTSRIYVMGAIEDCSTCYGRGYHPTGTDQSRFPMWDGESPDGEPVYVDLFTPDPDQGRATCPDCEGLRRRWVLETETETPCTTCDGLGHIDDAPYSRHERIHTAEVA
ncbi:MAG: hypothetical protein AAFV53_13070 [Myxococcota bacterium]